MYKLTFFWKEDNCSILLSCIIYSSTRRIWLVDSELISWGKAEKGMFPWNMQSSTTHYCGSWIWGREKDQIIWTAHPHLPRDIFKEGAEITIDNKSLILHLTEPTFPRLWGIPFIWKSSKSPPVTTVPTKVLSMEKTNWTSLSLTLCTNIGPHTQRNQMSRKHNHTSWWKKPKRRNQFSKKKLLSVQVLIFSILN